MEELELEGFDEEGLESSESQAVWEALSPEQKEYFKRIAEKSKENMRYIG